MLEIPAEVPAVDLDRHTVSLDKIYFDTFQPVNRAVALPDASPELIERLRDAIPPLHAPDYEVGMETSWLSAEDLVLGYVAGEQAWAFPLRILNFHEIVNDVLAGEAVLISFCPLCYSGIVYSRRLGDLTLTFGNTSALYESDMVMLDYQTGSYWWQVAGQGIVGPLSGERLAPLPSQIATWEAWIDMHPQTLVLSRDTGFQRDYSRDPFGGFDEFLNGGGFAFPVSEAVRDYRLDPGTRVLAVEAEGSLRVYPLDAARPMAYNDEINGGGVIVLVLPSPAQGAVFSSDLDGRRLHFKVQGESFVDDETLSTWNLAGRAVEGPLSGRQLMALPSKTTFWYAIIAAEPELELFNPGS